MPLLEVQHLPKSAPAASAADRWRPCSDVSFTVEEGEFVAIMGESGSGKTTLLNILAALDKPTSGQVFLNMRDIVPSVRRTLAAFRRDHLGFVFQDFNLLDTFSLQDNIFLPLVLAGKKYDGDGAKAASTPSPTGWAFGSCCKSSPMRSPAAKSSGRPSPGPSSPTRSSSWPTSPPAPWTPVPPGRYWTSSRMSTTAAKPF